MARPENTIWRHTPLPARVTRALFFRQSEEWTEAHEESLQPCLVRLVCGSGVVGGLSGVLPHCHCSPYEGAILKSHVRFLYAWLGKRTSWALSRGKVSRRRARDRRRARTAVGRFSHLLHFCRLPSLPTCAVCVSWFEGSTHFGSTYN